ncbi:hypothetical protein F442_13911 [Phytophthora nicotianae P10297]|uniref:Uncharacterized protein n=1 Tax=Phytophthora nicotianae P10297 TaxID=1317064 RepID=W2YTR1_PHYNI|nr:hypothetical protein F442_13911 [Phytophthora nicotianae P10297]
MLGQGHVHGRWKSAPTRARFGFIVGAQAWKQTPVEVVEKIVQVCGFNDDSSAWRITKHDVYGSKFRAAWHVRESGDCGSDHENDIAAVMETPRTKD